MKSILLGAAAFVVLSFPLAILWHLVAFKGFYAATGYFDGEPNLALGMASMVVQGVVMAYLYPSLRRGGGVVPEGVRFGLLMGAFLASSHILAFAAKQHVDPLGAWMVMESLWLVLQFSVTGVAIAAIYARVVRA